MPDEGPQTACTPTPLEEPPPRFDPLDPAFREDPYRFYRHFRRHDPVHRGAAPFPSRPDCVYLFRYRDARRVLENPDQLEAVRGSGRLDGPAVDELLRYESPVQMTFRVARSDTRIGGVPVGEGDTVAAVLGAANRDPEAFPAPDRLDVRRSDRPRLAFGGGPHHCLGSHLGTLEARVALGRLLQRYPDLSLPEEWEPGWSDSVLFRRLGSLPLELA